MNSVFPVFSLLPFLLTISGLLLPASPVQAAQEKGDGSSSTIPALPFRKRPAYIILKVDDLVVHQGQVHPAWQRLADFLKERKIKAAIGIICNSLEADNPRYFQWIKEQQASGRVEFWCHGYNHKQWTENGKTVQEFNGTSLEHQREALIKSEQLAKAKLGFPLTAFGAGFNAIDANTVKALKAVPEIAVWLYGNTWNNGGKIVLDRIGPVNIEQPTFVPDRDKFVTGYNHFPERDYFVIQGHPAQWNDDRFDQFTKIVDFLTEQGAIFTTPSEYVCLRKTDSQALPSKEIK